jgi:hypothetical protein
VADQQRVDHLQLVEGTLADVGEVDDRRLVLRLRQVVKAGQVELQHASVRGERVAERHEEPRRDAEAVHEHECGHVGAFGLLGTHRPEFVDAHPGVAVLELVLGHALERRLAPGGDHAPQRVDYG